MKIWKAHYRDGVLGDSLVYGEDEADAMSRAEANYRFHSGMDSKPIPAVDSVKEMPEGTAMGGQTIMPSSEFPPEHMDFERWRAETMAVREETNK